MVSLGFFEYSRYFEKWANEPSLKYAFTQKLVDIADYLHSDRTAVPKYILVNEGDVMVDEVPNNAQTIKFLTRTHSQTCSVQRNIYYLRDDQLLNSKFPAKFSLIPLSDNPKLRSNLFSQFGLYPEKRNSFTIYTK